jgi:hypothetical protein
MGSKRKYDEARKSYDFQNCSFKWLWQGPRPPAVVRMVEDRALRSFGPDTVVMQDRWNQPTVTGAVEAKVFPRVPYEDICCADVVGFCAYQTRVCDYLVASSFNRHWVDNYFPFKTKPYGDIAMLVGVYGPPAPGDPKLDESKFLPGDYFIYSRVFDWQSHGNHPHSPRERIEAGLNGGPTGDNVGDHIDMFLGSFVEVDNGQIVPPGEGGDVYDVINGSWGLDGSSYYVLPYARYVHLFPSEWAQGTYVVHCRLKAIDQLYRQLVGPPMRPTPAAIALPQPPPKKGDKKPSPPALPPLDANADLTDFYRRIDGAKAPFPVGTHFGWHQGVHVLQPTPPGPPPAPDPGLSDADQKTMTDANTAYGAAVADAYNGSGEVYPIAPGLIIAARGASSPDMTEGDTGFVLVRHLISADAKEVLDPKDVPPAGSTGAGKPPTPFFSLYMHLASLATFTDPAAKKDTDAVAPLKEHAPAWLRALWPRPLPDPTIVHETALTMLSPKGGDEKNGYVVVGKPKHLILPKDVSLANPIKKKTVDGVEYYIVPQWTDSQQAAWVAQPRPPAATGKLALFNPRTGKVIPTGQSLDGLAHIEAIADSKGMFRVQVEALDSGNYAHLDAFKRPALRKGGGGTDVSIAEDVRTDLPSSPQQVLVLPARASRSDSWDLMLTTTADGSAVKGPSGTLPWAAIVDADAEAARTKALADAGEPPDPTHHTTVGAIELKLTDDKHKIGWLWVDMVPCAKTASSKANLESALNGDLQRIAREAQTRLTTGVSRLVGAIASSKKDADWTLDGDTYTLTGAGTDKQPPRLYLSLKPYGKDFLIDDSAHGKKPDGTWMLAPPEGAGVKLHALATATGYGGAHNALVEVLYGVPVSEVDPANQKIIDAAKADNDERVKVINDLLAGKVVDLRQRRTEPLRVGREPIALMGHVVGSPGSDSGPIGVHFEVFAGKPLLLDGDAALGATLEPVTGTPWLGMADPAQGDLLDAKAARTLVKEAMKLPTFDPQSVLQSNPDGSAGASWAAPADDSAPWQPPSVDEWLVFCSANARLLSRVVTAHPSEWGLDWPESAGKPTATHNLQTRDTKDAVSRAHKSLKWSDGVTFIADDGLTDPTAIVFHHPARFIELMRTGIEVSVSTHEPGAASKATVTFTPTGKPPVTLVQPPGTPGRFVARISASEVAHNVEQPSLLGVVDVKPDGQAKPFSRQMLITRGVTTRMTVVSAWVEAGMEWAHGGRPFAIDVGERPAPPLTDGVIYFLADGGAFGSFGNGSVRLRASLNYNNVSTPTFTDPKLDKEKAGYTVASPKKQIPDSTKKEAPGTQFSSTSASLEFDLAATVTTLGAANGVSVTVSSDELEKAATVSWKVSTREITRGMSGPDVAQLQLYLAEILASDGLPCYRNDLAASGKAGIDGGYGPALRNALWRFCYTYASDQKGSGWAEPNIGFSKSGASNNVAAADLLAFTNAHHAVVGSAELSKDSDPDVAPWAARTQVAANTKAKQDDGSDWIVVTLGIIQSVVNVFRQGHEVPFIPAKLESKLPHLPAWRADAPAVVFAGKVPDQFNRGLPWPDFHVEATFTSEAKEAGGAKDGQVMVEVPADGPYQLRHAGSTGASFTVASSEVLSGSGMKCELVPVAGAKKVDKVTMKASWVGGKKWLMSQHALMAPRNFAQKYGTDDSGMDVALVQICLSQAPAKNADANNVVPVGFIPAPPAPPTPKAPPKGATTRSSPPKGIVTIDGVWSAAWVGALQRYAVEWGLAAKGKSVDSDAVVPKLLAHVLQGTSP